MLVEVIDIELLRTCRHINPLNSLTIEMTLMVEEHSHCAGVINAGRPFDEYLRNSALKIVKGNLELGYSRLEGLAILAVHRTLLLLCMWPHLRILMKLR